MVLVALLTPFLAVAVILAIAVPVALYYAWAASYLWGWFIVPIFNAPPLTTLQIWGICLTLALLRPRINMEKTNSDAWESGLIALVIGPWLALGLGYAIKFWWM